MVVVVVVAVVVIGLQKKVCFKAFRRLYSITTTRCHCCAKARHINNFPLHAGTDYYCATHTHTQCTIIKVIKAHCQMKVHGTLYMAAWRWQKKKGNLVTPLDYHSSLPQYG